MKKGIIINLLFLFLVIASCQANKENESNQVGKREIKDSAEVFQTNDLLDCEIKDTLIKRGKFEYQLKKIGKIDYKIFWGEKDEKKKYLEAFSCWKTKDDWTCDFTPKVELMTNEEVLLKVTTSTPSAGNCSPIEYKMIYLPRDKKQTPFEIEYYLKTENNYIVYSNSFDTIFVMNLKTKENQSFELNPKPYFEFKTIDNSLDSIQVKNKKLKFKYLIGTDKDHGYTKRELKLKI